jgi:hypothetical protein
MALSRPFRARSFLRTNTQGVALGYYKPPFQGSEYALTGLRKTFKNPEIADKFLR